MLLHYFVLTALLPIVYMVNEERLLNVKIDEINSHIYIYQKGFVDNFISVCKIGRDLFIVCHSISEMLGCRVFY